MDDSLLFIQATSTQITQETVITLIIVSTIMVLGLLVLIGIFAVRTKAPEGPLVYGNFFVVALGAMTTLIGFLVAFPLLVSGVFEDPTQVIALLSALFGTIVGLVGTFFGVKASSDATKQAHQLASDTISGDTSTPTVTSVNPRDRAVDVLPDARVTATFSRDMVRATINASTFKLLEQGDLNPVPGRVDYNDRKRTATLDPDVELEYGRNYEATITARVKDLGGNTMAEDHTWHFTVVEQGEDQSPRSIPNR